MCDQSKNGDPMSRDTVVEATRHFVLSVCVISGALAAFQMPLLKGLSSTSVAFATVASSIACYLIAILLGILHLLVLYHEGLYPDKSDHPGDILQPLKYLAKFLWGEVPKKAKDYIVTHINKYSPYFGVRAQFSLLLFGLLFSLGLTITLSFLVLRAYGVYK